MVRVGPGWHRAAGGWGNRIVPPGSQVRRRVLPRSLAPHLFTTIAEVPIGPYGFAQGIVSGAGTVTLNVGPQGAGTTWQLAQVSIGTTSGAADASTVEFFAQPTGTPAQPFQIGTSYAGGGDQVGLTGIKMLPGEQFYALWTGAKPGDTATMILTGMMTVLT